MSIIKILQENKEYEFVCESDFYCEMNNLTTLENVPNYVGRNFDCRKNNLKTLEGSPKYVGYLFLCSHNNLKTLKGAPIHVGGNFWCKSNPMLSKEEILQYHASGAVKGKIYSDHGVFI